MKTTINLDKCPICGGVLSLDENTGIIACQYCNHSFTYEELEDDEVTASEDDGFDEYSCSDCGGVIVTDQNSILSTCPYCGNTSVMRDRITGNYSPDYIIPFQITPKQAEENFTQVLHNNMVKRSFKNKFQIEEITSLFVPFWLYNTDISAAVTYEQITYDKKGNVIKKMKQARFVESYDKIPVDASLKMDDDKMDRIEPYDYSELKAFDKAYFIGHKAEKYDTDVGLMSKRAEKRMDKSARTSFSRFLYDNSSSVDDRLFHVMGTAASRATSNVVYGTMKAMGKEELLSNPNFEFDNEFIADNTNIDRIKKSKVKADFSDYRYALFPVYLIRGKYRGKNQLYYVNGQTGKAAEDFPFSYLTYYLNRIVGILIGSLFLGVIFFIATKGFMKIWENNYETQIGVSSGMIFLIAWLAAFLLSWILEAKTGSNKEDLRAARAKVGRVSIVQNAKKYRVPGSFKIIKD
jgi:DNA-directed RNA polymerase subunit RPC12/RpoP